MGSEAVVRDTSHIDHDHARRIRGRARARDRVRADLVWVRGVWCAVQRVCCTA